MKMGSNIFVPSPKIGDKPKNLLYYASFTYKHQNIHQLLKICFNLDETV